MVRPSRLAILTANPTVEDVCAAARAATIAWGGVYFPIIDLVRGQDHVRVGLRWDPCLNPDAPW